MKLGFNQTAGLAEFVDLLREKLGQDTPRFKEAEKLVTTSDHGSSSFDWNIIHEVWDKYLPEDGGLEAEFAIGDLIGERYRIVDWPHQSGGMGTVLKTLDSKVANRPTALKVFPQSYSKMPSLVEGIKSEVSNLAKLKHPNIVDVIDFDKHENSKGEVYYYIAMEFVEGRTLRERMNQDPRLLPPEIIDIAKEIAKGLLAIHQVGITHCDLKPENILISKDPGTVKIIDFGVSILAQMSPEIGRGKTLAYSSPEQVRGEIVDSKTDIWSLGVILCEMISGTRPFSGQGKGLENAILHDNPDFTRTFKTKIEKKFSRIIKKCLSKQPDGRFRRTDDILSQLQNLEPSHVRRIILVPSMLVMALIILGGLYLYLGWDKGSTAANAPVVMQEAPLANLQISAISPGGKWSGDWISKGSSYHAVATINEAGGKVSGQIVWTLTDTGNAAKRADIGTTAVEYLEGTFNSRTQILDVKGFRKVDPNAIIRLDKYTLSLSADGRTIVGKSINGQFTLTR